MHTTDNFRSSGPARPVGERGGCLGPPRIVGTLNWVLINLTSLNCEFLINLISINCKHQSSTQKNNRPFIFSAFFSSSLPNTLISLYSQRSLLSLSSSLVQTLSSSLFLSSQFSRSLLTLPSLTLEFHLLSQPRSLLLRLLSLVAFSSSCSLLSLPSHRFIRGDLKSKTVVVVVTACSVGFVTALDSRWISSSGTILSEDEKAAENVYIKVHLSRFNFS